MSDGRQHASLRNLQILVTGAAGFVGSHLVRRLVADGAHLHCLLRSRNTAWRIQDLLDRVRVWEGDLTDPPALQRIAHAVDPEIVFHLGADTGVRKIGVTAESLRRSMETNVGGMLHLLGICCERRGRLRCFVQTGGLEEYGNGTIPYAEEQREDPVSPYSASQVAATHYAQMLVRTQGLPIVILRPALTYGPAQANEFLIPQCIAHALRGGELAISSGDQGRDLLYIEDLVEAYCAAALTPQIFGEVINIGSGREYRMRDVAALIGTLMQAELAIVHGHSSRPIDIVHLVCRNEKARRLLGWAPHVGLEEGLLRTIAWYRTHG